MQAISLILLRNILTFYGGGVELASNSNKRKSMKKIYTSALLSIFLFLFCATFAYSESINLLQNSSFETIGWYGSSTSLTSSSPPWAPGYSAAESWTVWNNTAATTTTELVNSTFDDNLMLHVTTTGYRNGIVQVFDLFNQGYTDVLSSVWVYVNSGQAAMGTGNGGLTDFDTNSSGTGTWELLEAYNGGSPANEFIVYSASTGGADFYVDLATISPLTNPVPESSTLLLIGSGLAMFGLMRIRKFFKTTAV